MKSLIFLIRLKQVKAKAIAKVCTGLIKKVENQRDFE
jgi:hypothetical protein